MACVLGLSFSQWSIISFFEIWNYTSWNGSLPTTWLVPRCGSPKTLKLSQVYPRGYGKAIMKHHTSWNVPWDLVWRMVAPLSCDVIIGSLYTNVYFQPYHGPRQSLPMSWTSRRAFLKLTLRWLFPRWDGMEDVAGRKIKKTYFGIFVIWIIAPFALSWSIDKDCMTWTTLKRVNAIGFLFDLFLDSGTVCLRL